MVNYGGLARLIYVDTYGADPTGTRDSTAAFLAAQAAGGTGSYQIQLSEGTYVIGGAGDLGVFGRGQGMAGPGSAGCTISYTGNGTAVAAFDSSFSSSLSIGGRFSGFTISGTGAGSAAVGMSWGNLLRARCTDINITGFTGATAIGLNLKNGAAAWSEQGEWTAIRVSGCTQDVVFDTGSFDYSLYQFVLFANASQDGIVLQNGAALEGCRLEVRGNFQCGTGNTGAVFAIDRGNSAGTSRIDGCQLYVSVEADGNTGTGHQSLLMGGGASSQFNMQGVLQFRDGASNGFAPPSIGSSVASSNVWASGLVSYSGQQVTYSDPPFGAAEYGVAGLTLDPAAASGTSNPVSGTIYMWAVPVRFPRRVSKIIIPVAGTAASGVTAGQNFVGLYDFNGNQLASTATDSAFGSTFTDVTVNITAQTLKPGLYWIAFLMNATGMPLLCRSAATSSAVTNLNLGAAVSRFATAGTVQTAIPASFTPSTLTGSSLAFLAALL